MPSRSSTVWKTLVVVSLVLLPRSSKVVVSTGALATGATCEIVADRNPGIGQPYAELRHDPDLLTLYERNALALGRTFPDVAAALSRFAMTTDMGNVSQVLPTIHPMIGVGRGALNHEPAFAAKCVTPVADAAVLDGALAMAWTVIDAAADDDVRQRLIDRAQRREVAA